MTISFFVAGKPQPRGSKQSFVPLDRNTKEPFRRPNGGIVVATVDDNPKGKDWMACISRAAQEAMNGLPPITGPVSLHLEFIMPRPKGHYGSGKNSGVLKTSAPYWHTGKPDRLKLARGVEDALTAIVYADDAQTIAGPITKHYGTNPGVAITVSDLPHGNEP